MNDSHAQAMQRMLLSVIVALAQGVTNECG